MPGISQNSADSKKIQHSALVGLFLNVFLSLLKGYAGFLAGSRALIADAVHSFSDLTTDIAVIVGAKYWTRPPDESHPIGHKGIESATSFFIGLMLFFAGVTIGFDSVKSLGTNSSSMDSSVFAVIAASISLVSKEILFRWTMKKAKETGSGALAANAWHHRSDGLSSIPVLLAVIAPLVSDKLNFLDSVGGVIVSVFILKTSWSVLRPAFGEVVNAAPPPEIVEKFHDIAIKVAGVQSIHQLRARMQGGGIFVDLHLQLNGEISVKEGFLIAKEVELQITGSDTSVRDVIARIEPAVSCGDADNCVSQKQLFTN